VSDVTRNAIANVFPEHQTEDRGLGMVNNRIRTIAAITAVTGLTATGIAGATLKDSPPVGPLPSGPTSTIVTQ
jgi:hypothetical protein